jgi:hypothetical protein
MRSHAETSLHREAALRRVLANKHALRWLCIVARKLYSAQEDCRRVLGEAHVMRLDAKCGLEIGQEPGRTQHGINDLFSVTPRCPDLRRVLRHSDNVRV